MSEILEESLNLALRVEVHDMGSGEEAILAVCEIRVFKCSLGASGNKIQEQNSPEPWP